MSERALRTQSFPLPRTAQDIALLVKRAVGLPHVQELRVTPRDVQIDRLVLPEEDILPPELVPGDLTAESIQAILTSVPFPFEPDEHSYIRLVRAFRFVEARRMNVVAVLAPNPAEFQAFLGFEGEDMTSFFGVPVYYFSEGVGDKVVLVGSGSDLRGASLGVLVDMGD